MDLVWTWIKLTFLNNWQNLTMDWVLREYQVISVHFSKCDTGTGHFHILGRCKLKHTGARWHGIWDSGQVSRALPLEYDIFPLTVSHEKAGWDLTSQLYGKKDQKLSHLLFHTKKPANFSREGVRRKGKLTSSAYFLHRAANFSSGVLSVFNVCISNVISFPAKHREQGHVSPFLGVPSRPGPTLLPSGRPPLSCFIFVCSIGCLLW